MPSAADAAANTAASMNMRNRRAVIASAAKQSTDRLAPRAH
jgi:hypothetical protein